MVLLCFLGSLHVFALDPAKSVFQFNCTSWTREDGLPANGINGITQTEDGYLWLGTQKGLVRFDGIEFKPFSPPNTPYFRNQIISALCHSHKGGLWFGLRDGSFGSYDDSAGFSPPPNDPWVGPTMGVLSIREVSDGSVWIGANQGTARWVSGETNLTSYYTNLAGGWTLYEGTGGRVWLGTVERGLYFWQGGKLSAFPDATLENASVTAFAEDRLGGLWVGTKMGLRYYDANFQRQVVPPLPAEVKALLVDRNGVLWIGTTGLGLATFKHGVFTYFQRADGLANENVTTLFEDREGTLWIGTRSGLSQLTDVKLSVYSAADGILGRGCHGVYSSAHGGVWGAMTLGVSYFNGTSITNYSQESGLSINYMKLVFEARDGDIYLINGNKDIEVLSEGKIVARYPNTTWPTALAQDAQSVVASIGDSLFRVTRTQLVPYEYSTADSPQVYWVRSMFTCRDGSILVASVNGLFRLKQGLFEHWSAQDGLPDNDVHWVCQDDQGVLWAGLTVGIARIQGREIRNITMNDGLHDNYIYSIVPDDHGSLWLNSSRGVFRVSRQELNDFADRRTNRVESTAFDSLEAVKVIDTTEVEYSGCKTADGRIWFPSPQGLVMINPTNLFSNPTPPPVHIQQVRANDCELIGRQHSALRPGKGSLEFQYTAASFIAPQKVRFRYRLKGYEPDWVDAGARRSAFYTNLKPGKYWFEVQACNADGIWNTTGDSIEIQLPPHFYQTTWFMIAMGLLVVAGLFGLYGWRVKRLTWKQNQLQQAHSLLEAKVQERTSELKNEIEERKRMEVEVKRIHGELVDASRRAGQAEVASSVLHNVGNVLNSVNVSATLVADQVSRSKTSGVSQIAELLGKHRNDLAGFLTSQGRGEQVLEFLQRLAQQLQAERAGMLGELTNLTGNVEHIKEIVAMQQNYSQVSGVIEIESIPALVENALRTQATALEHNHVRVVRELEPIPDIPVDKHKVLQILVNLIINANHAVANSGSTERVLTLGIRKTGDNLIRVSVTDNGVGIPAKNLTRIFSHGFTTRRDGHGFGLHSGSLAARQMGGSLVAHSDGPGKGATFILELPCHPNQMTARAPQAQSAPCQGRDALPRAEQLVDPARI
jgi:ligand-binding sensor domain-containing protein/signal transduction histidine kinase